METRTSTNECCDIARNIERCYAVVQIFLEETVEPRAQLEIFSMNTRSNGWVFVVQLVVIVVLECESLHVSVLLIMMIVGIALRHGLESMLIALLLFSDMRLWIKVSRTSFLCNEHKMSINLENNCFSLSSVMSLADNTFKLSFPMLEQNLSSGFGLIALPDPN